MMKNIIYTSLAQKIDIANSVKLGALLTKYFVDFKHFVYIVFLPGMLVGIGAMVG